MKKCNVSTKLSHMDVAKRGLWHKPFTRSALWSPITNDFTALPQAEANLWKDTSWTS